MVLATVEDHGRYGDTQRVAHTGSMSAEHEDTAIKRGAQQPYAVLSSLGPTRSRFPLNSSSIVRTLPERAVVLEV